MVIKLQLFGSERVRSPILVVPHGNISSLLLAKAYDVSLTVFCPKLEF